MIADASARSARFWEEIQRTALALFDLLADQYAPELFLLGDDRPISRAELAARPPGAASAAHSAMSLIAPVLRTLARRRQPVHAVIIVGSGEVFDLADWVGHPIVGRWIAVRPGLEVAHAEATVSVISSREPGRALELLALPAQPYDYHATSPAVALSYRSYRWTLDRLGYPLIWVEPLAAYVQLFPVTKMQFEQYLAEARPPQHGDAWYAGLLALNPRAAPRNGARRSYERLFITGVLPDEASGFCSWAGANYRLLDTAQWRTCYHWLARQSSSSIPPALDHSLAWGTRAVWETVEAATRPRSLLDLSLMAQGVIEWVAEPVVGLGYAWVGLGKTRAGFAPPALRRPIDPIRPIAGADPERLAAFGFRLMMQEP